MILLGWPIRDAELWGAEIWYRTGDTPEARTREKDAEGKTSALLVTRWINLSGRLKA